VFEDAGHEVAASVGNATALLSGSTSTGRRRMTSRSCAESSGSVLAVEDSEHFDQRAKIDDYDDFVFLVV
jgi:hypothetical protein